MLTRPFDVFGGALCCAVALATGAAFAARAGWFWELFSHFRVQYLVAAGMLALIFLLGRRFRLALLAAVLMAVNAAALIQYFLPTAHAAPGNKHPGRELRVVSLNVYVENTDIERTLRYLQRVNADVVVLLEITEQWRAPLQGLSARYPFVWLRPGNERTGIAVFSRVTPEQTRLLDLANNGTVSLLMTLRRSQDSRLSIIGTHLSTPVGSAPARLRNRQLEALARVAREHPWPLIIVGDLNITSFSPVFQRLLTNGNLVDCAAGGWHPTWPAFFPPLFIQIDHCLATPSAVARNFRVGPNVGSDHYPIEFKAGIELRTGFAKP